ncbi:MAG: RCC1 domain-containing protein [Limisphaerales bacterium]
MAKYEIRFQSFANSFRLSAIVFLLLHALAAPAAITVTNIAQGCEAFHSLFLKSDGSLWAMGENYSGELGDGTFNSTNRPEEIVSSGVTAMAAGEYYSLFLKSNGSLWAMGTNGDGELGDGTFNSTNRPEEIVASNVTAIAAGRAHSLFLKSDRSLWAMGNNNQGQLGDGTLNAFVNQPEEIVASNVTAIAAGEYHSLFLRSDGSLWAMGADFFGELGDGTNNDTSQPEEIVAGGVTAIAAGNNHSLFLKSGGTLWAMGENNSGELGDGFNDINPPYGTYTPEQIFPPPPPVLAQTFSNTDLQFTAPCGFGGTFYLLAGTNLAQLLSQWTPVWTNTIRYRLANIFSATLTNAVNSGNQQFYILQSQ